MAVTLQEALDALTPLGFQEDRIREAFGYVGGSGSIEDMANFLLVVDNTHAPPTTVQHNTPHKLVLIVNSKLTMSSGKIASQCSHATLGAVLALGGMDNQQVRQWLAQGEPIIVVQSGTTFSLTELETQARSNDLPVYLIRDAGRTEIEPGSMTVLAVGPAPNEAIDRVTRTLALF